MNLVFDHWCLSLIYADAEPLIYRSYLNTVCSSKIYIKALIEAGGSFIPFENHLLRHWTYWYFISPWNNRKHQIATWKSSERMFGKRRSQSLFKTSTCENKVWTRRSKLISVKARVDQHQPANPWSLGLWKLDDVTFQVTFLLLLLYFFCYDIFIYINSHSWKQEINGR